VAVHFRCQPATGSVDASRPERHGRLHDLRPDRAGRGRRRLCPGLDFAFNGGTGGSCNALVNYSGQTGIAGAAPLGELWQVVDITFLDGTGPRVDRAFVHDTDNDPRGMVPEPGTYALMLGGLGLLSVPAKRRRRS
jgi:hypothetical protein